MIQKSILFVLGILLFGSAFSQDSTLKSLDEVAKISSQVTDKFAEKEYEKGILLVQPFFKITTRDILQLISDTELQLSTFQPVYGEVVGKGLLKATDAGDYLHKEVHTVRYKRNLIRLVFIWYKNDEGWLLNSFEWDDAMGELFED